jgi:hypothetical protein
MAGWTGLALHPPALVWYVVVAGEAFLGWTA